MIMVLALELVLRKQQSSNNPVSSLELTFNLSLHVFLAGQGFS